MKPAQDVAEAVRKNRYEAGPTHGDQLRSATTLIEADRTAVREQCAKAVEEVCSLYLASHGAGEVTDALVLAAAAVRTVP